MLDGDAFARAAAQFRAEHSRPARSVPPPDDRAARERLIAEYQQIAKSERWVRMAPTKMATH